MSANFSAQGSTDDAAVRAALERVLARPEFQPEKHPLRDWLLHRLDALEEWVKEFFGVSRETADQILAWMFYLLIAAVALALIVWIVRASARALRRSRSQAGASSSPVDVRAARVAELEARAREAEARGDHALALRLYFWALVVGLGQRGGLEYRDAWTNRELLERGAPAPEVDRVLRPLVPELDRKTFGPAGAEAEDVARLSKLCHEMLGAGA